MANAQAVYKVYAGTKTDQRILFLCGDKSQFTLARAMADAVEHPCVFYFSDANLLNDKFADAPEHISYTDDLTVIALNAGNFSLVVTFGCLGHVNHLNALTMVSLFKRIGVPVVDVQHGLFQWGINFTDHSKFMGFLRRPGEGINLQMQVAADHILTWGGEDGIGYPRNREEFTANDTVLSLFGDEPYALIATNSNWHIYSDEDRLRLYRCVVQLGLEYPEQKFIWKPHPAEINRSLIGELSRYGLPSNIIFYSANEVPLENLVKGCSFGIATPGTALIDFEMCGKPTLIFDCASNHDLNAQYQKAKTFASTEELIEGVAGILNAFEANGGASSSTAALAASGAELVSGLLKPFDVEKCRKVLFGLMHAPKSYDLKECLEHFVLLDRVGYRRPNQRGQIDPWRVGTTPEQIVAAAKVAKPAASKPAVAAAVARPAAKVEAKASAKPATLAVLTGANFGWRGFCSSVLHALRNPRQTHENEVQLACRYWQAYPDIGAHPDYGLNSKWGIWAERIHYDRHGKDEGRKFG